MQNWFSLYNISGMPKFYLFYIKEVRVCLTNKTSGGEARVKKIIGSPALVQLVHYYIPKRGKIFYEITSLLFAITSHDQAWTFYQTPLFANVVIK